MPKYPAQIDTTSDLPTVVDNFTPIRAVTINRLRDTILAIEAELGIKPRGLSSTVKARLDALETTVNSIDFIELNGDLGNTLSSPEVIGIRGNPVSSVEPIAGDVLIWSGTAWIPQPAADVSTFSGNGDLDGGPFIQTVIGIRGDSIADIAPLDGYVLVNAFGTWCPDYLYEDNVKPLIMTLTPTAGTLIEVGDTLVTPAFLASYTLPNITNLSITDDENNTPDSIPDVDKYSFSSVESFIFNNHNDSVTFTLSAIQGRIQKEATATVYWVQKMYWGANSPGETGAVFILTLSDSALTRTKVYTFTATATAGQSIYFACRANFGNIIFTVNGLQGGFTFINDYTLTNNFGIIENFSLYESEFTGLGEITVTTS